MAWNSSNFVASNWDAAYWRSIFAVGGFPTQYDGYYYWDGVAVRGLCLVAEVDAPLGVGAVRYVEGSTGTYAIYLVPEGDPDASPVYQQTTTGIYAVRFKT